jgi:succinate dehydrogenase / fumarate reductase, cytochrome b subunit
MGLIEDTTVGKKMIMAVTGILMVLFVIVHMFGNLTVYAGALNSYAHHLRGLPPLLWLFRAVMICAIVLHIIYGIRLYLINKGAKPQPNNVVKYRKASVTGTTMIWTGLLLLAFIVYHILQFTAHVTNPDISAFLTPQGFPDVQRMVVLAFERPLITAGYLLAMIFLLLHLTHGIQSFVQTLGWNSDRSLPVVGNASRVIAIVVFAGFISVPLTAISRVIGP